jgi:hypothetical protein
MSRRAVLLILATAVTVLLAAAGFPAGASANISPQVGVVQPTGNAGGSTSTAGILISFNQTGTDAVRDLSVTLPEGLLFNLETNGGACLTATAPTVACQIGSGTATIGGASTPLTLYLEKAPVATELAGIQLVAGPISLLGSLDYHSTTNIGLTTSLDADEQITWNGLPGSPVVSAIDFTLTGMTFPSSCLPSDVVVEADSQQEQLTQRASALFPVTNCLALPYTPSVTTQISRDAGITGVGVQVSMDNAAGDSNTEQLRFKLPPNIQLNPAMAPCFEGVSCVIGTVSASSPLFPPGELSGPLTLSGTLRQPILGMAFAPPVDLQLETVFSPTELFLDQIPDIPMTSFVIEFRGNSLGAVFVGLCYKADWKANFGAWSGEAKGPTTIQTGQSGIPNCYHPPTTPPPGVTGSARLSGAASQSARLSIETSTGRGEPGIVSLAISLPAGLAFDGQTPLTGSVVSLSGAKLANAQIRNGALVVRLRRPSAHTGVILRSPLLVSRSGLTHDLVSRRAPAAHVILRITDSRGHQTRLAVPLKVS